MRTTWILVREVSPLRLRARQEPVLIERIDMVRFMALHIFEAQMRPSQVAVQL
jgi:hypothetical protein